MGRDTGAGSTAGRGSPAGHCHGFSSWTSPMCRLPTSWYVPWRPREMSSYIEQSSRFRPWGANVLVGLSALMPGSLPPANLMSTHCQTLQGTRPSPVPTLHSPHKDFHLHSHPGHPPRTSNSAIVSVGDGGAGEYVCKPPGCQEVLYQSWEGASLKPHWVSGRAFWAQVSVLLVLSPA